MFFFCKFCEISKNTFSYRTPLVAASVHVGNLFTYLSKFLGVNKPIKKKTTEVVKRRRNNSEEQPFFSN